MSSSSRIVKTGVLDLEPKFYSNSKATALALLRALTPLKVTLYKALKELPRDLDILIIQAEHLSSEDVLSCSDRIRRHLKDNGLQNLPFLLIASPDLDVSQDFLRLSLKENWYSDLIDPHHIESLPPRLANLIRIHDHLRELARYDQVVRDLEERISKLEVEINHATKKSN